MFSSATLARILSKHGPRQGSCSERGFAGEHFHSSRERAEQHPHLRRGQAGLLKVTRGQHSIGQPARTGKLECVSENLSGGGGFLSPVLASEYQPGDSSGERWVGE